MPRHLLFSTPIVCLLLGTSAWAETTVREEDELEYQSWLESFAAPEAPAMLALGLTTSEISRPGSVNELGAAFASFITPEGTLRTGAAVELSPRAFEGLQSTTSDYQNHWYKRFFERSSLSFAAASELGARRTVLLGIGLRLVFFDEADPLLFGSRVAEAARKAKQACQDPEMDGQAYGACLDRNYQPTPMRWNASGLGLTSGLVLSTPADTLDFVPGRLVAHLTGTLGLSTWLELAARAGYRGENFTTTSEHLFSGALRVRMGDERIRVAAEYVAELGDYDPDPFIQASFRHSLKGILQLRLSQGLWLGVNLGGDLEQGKLSTLANLEWGFTDVPLKLE